MNMCLPKYWAKLNITYVWIKQTISFIGESTILHLTNRQF